MQSVKTAGYSFLTVKGKKQCPGWETANNMNSWRAVQISLVTVLHPERGLKSMTVTLAECCLLKGSTKLEARLLAIWKNG